MFASYTMGLCCLICLCLQVLHLLGKLTLLASFLLPIVSICITGRWALVKSSCSPRPPVTLALCGGSGASFLPDGGGILVSLQWLTLIPWGCGGLHYHQMGIKVPALYLAFSDSTPQWVSGHLIIAWQGWKSEFLTLSLLAMGVGPQYFLWCLAGVKRLLSKGFQSC